MNNLAIQIQELAAILSSAELTVKKFQELRNHCSEELWEEVTNEGQLAELLDQLADLEYTLEAE